MTTPRPMEIPTIMMETPMPDTPRNFPNPKNTFPQCKTQLRIVLYLLGAIGQTVHLNVTAVLEQGIGDIYIQKAVRIALMIYTRLIPVEATRPTVLRPDSPTGHPLIKHHRSPIWVLEEVMGEPDLVKRTIQLVKLPTGVTGALAAQNAVQDIKEEQDSTFCLLYPTDLVMSDCMTSKVAMPKIMAATTMDTIGILLKTKWISMKNQQTREINNWLKRTLLTTYKIMIQAIFRIHLMFVQFLWTMEVAMDTLRGGTLTPKVELAKRSATLDAMETGTTLHPSRNAWPLVSMTMTTACMFKIMGPNLLIGANQDKTCMTTQPSFLMMPGSKIFKAGPS